MNFWVRENGSPPFHGPFSAAEVAAALQAGRFSPTCEVLEAVGQSYGALKTATGWRSARDVDLPAVSEFRPRLAKPGRPYPALEMLAGWYTFLAVMCGIAGGIGCVIGVMTAFKAPGVGILTLLVSLASGAVSVVTLLAFAEGIKLAIHLATDLRDIREQLSQRER